MLRFNSLFFFLYCIMDFNFWLTKKIIECYISIKSVFLQCGQNIEPSKINFEFIITKINIILIVYSKQIGTIMPHSEKT